ncbi:hypothetical protein [Bordetella genomosp. 1]|uniref:hypothetical protein n=1 Tax=Bordetella genomosp. 1 TaxID=1395607 RepID=UPI001177D8E2|nr:hypothetical protein [Bordetella genomosp. 1]
MHFIVITANAESQKWLFFVGMNDAKRPIWGEPGNAIHFPTFRQARRIARRVGHAQVCSSIVHQKAIK